MFTMKYLIFVAFLLATANAFPFNVYKRDEHLVRLYKRATTFTPCPKGSPIPLNVTTDVDPTIGKTFTATVVFTTDKDYPKMFLTTTFTEDGGKAIDGGVTTADLCAKAVGLNCPVPKGQQVTVTAKTAVPDAAKLPYDIEFNVNDGDVTIGCSTAKIVADGTAPAPGGAAPGAAPAPAPGDGGAPPAGGKAAPAPAPGDGGAPAAGGPPKAAPAAGGPPKAAPGGAPADGGAGAGDGGAGAGDGGAGAGDGGAGAGDGGAGPGAAGPGAGPGP